MTQLAPRISEEAEAEHVGRLGCAVRDHRPVLHPARGYFDGDFFELENEKLWPHVWQMACRLEEIPNVGDYVEYWVATIR